MGIRFLCPNGHKLNVKADLAGKRASCPECGAKLVIPSTDAASVAPEAIVVKPAAPAGAVWYVRTAGGEQLGPATDSQFSDWIHAGKVNADALVWRDSWDQWKLARDAADELPVPLAAVTVPTPSPAAITAAALSPLRQPPARESVAAPAPDLDPAPPETVASDPIVAEVAAPAARYVVQRRRSKKTQLILAVLMLVTVIVLAGVLVWVVRNNSALAPAPQTSSANSRSSFGASAAGC